MFECGPVVASKGSSVVRSGSDRLDSNHGRTPGRMLNWAHSGDGALTAYAETRRPVAQALSTEKQEVES